jgi:hypothetical protein
MYKTKTFSKKFNIFFMVLVRQLYTSRMFLREKRELMAYYKKLKRQIKNKALQYNPSNSDCYKQISAVSTLQISRNISQGDLT